MRTAAVSPVRKTLTDGACQPVQRGAVCGNTKTCIIIGRRRMADKALVWLGSSLKDLQDFPALGRRLAGFQLRRVQQGLDPDDWKPMKTVGPGVREIGFTLMALTASST
jgi:hypothetical protein